MVAPEIPKIHHPGRHEMSCCRCQGCGPAFDQHCLERTSTGNLGGALRCGRGDGALHMKFGVAGPGRPLLSLCTCSRQPCSRIMTQTHDGRDETP